jgi:hypothetical protein
MYWVEKSYPVFLYTGIIFFIVHLLIYGLGIDQSYFGLVLAYIGYSRIGLNMWIFGILWLGLILEGINLGKTIYERYFKPTNSNKKKEKREKGKMPR